MIFSLSVCLCVSFFRSHISKNIDIYIPQSITQFLMMKLFGTAITPYSSIGTSSCKRFRKFQLNRSGSLRDAHVFLVKTFLTQKQYGCQQQVWYNIYPVSVSDYERHKENSPCRTGPLLHDIGNFVTVH